MNEQLVKYIGSASAGVLLTVLAIFGVEEVAHESPITGDGSDQLSAVEICQMPQTEVFLVTDTASGEKQYQAKHVTSQVRYDLTWQTENPEAIAVEELRGQDFRPRAEQYSPEFAACLAGKNVVPVQGSH